MQEQKENTQSANDNQIGRELASHLFNSRIPLEDRYTIAGAKARALLQTDSPSHVLASIYLEEAMQWKARADTAEMALEKLRSYLERRLRDLDAGFPVSGHQEACQQIVDLSGYKIIPAQPLTVVQK